MATELRFPENLAGVDGIVVTRWLVKVGETVQPGDILLEAATDKVDTEVPATVGGVILQLNYGDGEILPADPVLGLVGAPDESLAAPAPAVSPAPAAQALAPEPAPEPPAATPVARRMAEQLGVDLSGVEGSGLRGQITKEDVLAQQATQKGAAAPAAATSLPAPAVPAAATSLPAAAVPAVSADADLRDLASLTVRRLAAEYSINLREVAAGRPLSALTKYDLLSAIASRDEGKPVTVAPRAVPAAAPMTPAAPIAPTAPVAPVVQAAPTAPATPAAPPKPAASAAPAPVKLQAGEEFAPHNRMRLLVARNTTQAAFSIPHVTTMWDVNMVAVLEHRKAHKAEFAAAGVNLTVTAYLIQAILAGLKATPAANSTWTDDGLIVKRYYHIGMAVALPADAYGVGGLIVPVIKNAGDLNLLGVARAVNDVAERARKGQLRADELQGGTFTLTNYGVSGSRFQTPVIVNGQAGILGVGAIEKRPVVVSKGGPLEANAGDYLAFLPMTTLGFSYDHRILDGATADAFCAAVKAALEKWQ